jgi:hypothetical protein
MRKLLLIAALITTPAFAQDKGYTAFVTAAKQTLGNALKDPGSVQYKALFVSKRDTPTGHELSLCGQMNAKNSYGGYEGFRSFIATEGGWASFDQTPDIYAIYCGNKLRDVK